jgi:hypothetical protein
MTTIEEDVMKKSITVAILLLAALTASESVSAASVVGVENDNQSVGNGPRLAIVRDPNDSFLELGGAPGGR